MASTNKLGRKPRWRQRQLLSATFPPQDDASPPNNLAPVKALVDAVGVKAPCGDAVDQNQSDLCQQWRMAEAADQMINISWAQLLLTSASLIGLAATIFVTTRANSIARTIGDEQTRAYVYAKSFFYDPKSISSPFMLEVKNGGQTPAKHFCVRQVLYFTDDASDKTTNFPSSLKAENWGCIGPGDTLTVAAYTHNGVGIDNKDGKVRESFQFNVMGTIRYMTIHDEWFETDFTYFCKSQFIGVGKKIQFSRPIVGGMRSFEKAKNQSEIN
jgi:hypothetical protein